MGLRQLLATAKGATATHIPTTGHGPAPPHKQDWPHRANDSVSEITKQAIAVCLLSAQADGQIAGIGHWQAANAYTAALLHAAWSRDPATHATVALVGAQTDAVLARNRDCINDFNDDTLWWAAVLLLLYRLSDRKELRWLQHAASLHAHVARSVLPDGTRDGAGGDASGSVLWKSTAECRETNAITCALYGEFSADLAAAMADGDAGLRAWVQLPSSEALLRTGVESVDFVLRRLWDDGGRVVVDTLKLESGEVVRWGFSYNTGQTIAACVALHRAAVAVERSGARLEAALRARADELLVKAVEMGRTAVGRGEWVEDGIVCESGAYGKGKHPATQNDDAVGFKSVLVRALAKLWMYLGQVTQSSGDEVVLGLSKGQAEELRGDIRALLNRTYESLRKNASNDIGQYGPWWKGPMDTPTSHSQMAVLDVMAAMRLWET